MTQQYAIFINPSRIDDAQEGAANALPFDPADMPAIDEDNVAYSWFEITDGRILERWATRARLPEEYES